MSLDIARSVTSLETYMYLYIHWQWIRTWKEKRGTIIYICFQNNETRDEKDMESCPLHCIQLHVFHYFAVVNQFLNIKYKKDLKIFYEIKYVFLLYLFPLHWLKSGEKWNIRHECKSRTLKWPSVFGLLTLNGVYK